MKAERFVTLLLLSRASSIRCVAAHGAAISFAPTSHLLARRVLGALLTVGRSVVMLALFETPAGFALFKVTDEKKLKKLSKHLSKALTPDAVRELYVAWHMALCALHQSACCD